MDTYKKLGKDGRKHRPRPPTGTPASLKTQPWGSGGIIYPPQFTEKITMDKVMHWIESTEIPARYDNDKFLYRQAKAMGFPGMVVECSHPK